MIGKHGCRRRREDVAQDWALASPFHASPPTGLQCSFSSERFDPDRRLARAARAAAVAAAAALAPETAGVTPDTCSTCCAVGQARPASRLSGEASADAESARFPVTAPGWVDARRRFRGSRAHAGAAPAWPTAHRRRRAVALRRLRAGAGALSAAGADQRRRMAGVAMRDGDDSLRAANLHLAPRRLQRTLAPRGLAGAAATRRSRPIVSRLIVAPPWFFFILPTRSHRAFSAGLQPSWGQPGTSSPRRQPARIRPPDVCTAVFAEVYLCHRCQYSREQKCYSVLHTSRDRRCSRAGHKKTGGRTPVNTSNPRARSRLLNP